MSIGENLKHALKMRGMTQKELANKTRLTEVTISRYLNEERKPNYKAIKTICKVLNVSADWLLDIKEQSK